MIAVKTDLEIEFEPGLGGAFWCMGPGDNK